MRHPFLGGCLCPFRHFPCHALVWVGRSQNLNCQGILPLLQFVVVLFAPGIATPPSTGSRAASRPGSQGPTFRGPSGTAGILPPKAQSWATSKVGSGLFPVRFHKYLIGGLPHLHQGHSCIYVLPHTPGRAETRTFPLVMRRQGRQPLQRRRQWGLQGTTSIPHLTFDYSSYSSHRRRGR